MDNENGCFASNKYLAEFIGVSITSISLGIKKLMDLGYVETESFDGRKRVLRILNDCIQEVESQLVEEPKADLQDMKGRVKKSENIVIHSNNTDNNTSNKNLSDKKIVSNYTKMIGLYDKFCKERVGVGCKINGQEGKALKNIIKYLTNQTESEEQVFEAWKYVLEHWDEVEEFYRKQIKISQIDSNLMNILNQLKNGKKRTESNIEQKIRDRVHSRSR